MTSTAADERYTVDLETGEVTFSSMQHALFEDKDKRFEITDQRSAEWYVNKVTEMQDEIDKYAVMAKTKIMHAYKKLMHFQQFFDPQLKQYCVGELEKRRTKSGTIRDGKNVRFVSGGVYFSKTGGWKLVDRVKLQMYINELPVEKLEVHGVTVIRKFNPKECQMFKSDLPGYEELQEQEFGEMKLGKEKPWTISTALKQLDDIKSVTVASEEE